jgi:hypothetical protein
MRLYWEVARRAVQRQLAYRTENLAGLFTNAFFGFDDWHASSSELLHPTDDGLTVVIAIKEGDGALNNIRQLKAKEPVVVITDPAGKPIKGAAVSFILPELGASGVFTSGPQQLVTTDENGVAVDQKDWGLTTSAVESFGVDFAGELYMISGDNIVKIAPVS